MLNIINGNLVELFKQGKYNVLIHQTNCQHTIAENRATGIAGVLMKEFPDLKLLDAEEPKGDINRLGQLSILSLPNDKYIINAYSQYNYGLVNGTIPTSYLAVDACFAEIDFVLREKMSTSNFIPRIGTYKIGCNRGGADWNRIRSIIETHLIPYQIDIVELN